MKENVKELKEMRKVRIREIIENEVITTQQDLVERLKKEFGATQATISRDIREMKLTKVQTDEGFQKYVIPSTREPLIDKKKLEIIRTAIVSVDTAVNLIVIKTHPGMAMACAAALDAMEIKNLVGCIAGDDTIMCAMKSERDAIEGLTLIQSKI
ncbi:MAG: arginine repressor [Lachnospiraceae bacterium]|nr:arginine repressor [Lachnospiraceae bacterium]